MTSPTAQRKLVRELLGKLDELLQIAYQRAQALYEQREGGEVRPWAYRGLYISKEQVERHFTRESAEPSLSATQGNAAALDPFGKAALWGSFGQHLGLSPFDVAVTMLALAPEVDARYGRLYAYLQDDVTRRRPSVNLALEVLAPSADAKLSERAHFLGGSPLVRAGLLSLVADPAQVNPTLLDHYLKLNDQAVAHLLGQADAASAPGGTFVVRYPVTAQADAASELRALIPLIIDANTYLHRLTLYFCGSPGMGQRDAAQVLADALTTPLVITDLASLSTQPALFQEELASSLREGALREALIFLDGFDSLRGDAAAERRQLCLRALEQQPGTVLLGGTHAWAPPPGTLEGTIVLEFPDAGVDARREAWARAIKQAQVSVEAGTLDLLAQRYPLSLDQVASAVRTVASRLRWNAEQEPERVRPVLQELMAAARARCGAELAGLAQRIIPRRGFADLVLPVATKRQLRELCQRVEHGQRVLEEWGFDRKMSYGKGVSALFSGPSGTGKTMAAEVIARELGLELFKVDLSQVVSKYIGETEKNLESIFVAAERTGAILFFDEADSLFGKRSEIHDAHDRYANIEVGYLLQRMERYGGVAILATNLRGNLDDAFTRRVAHAIQFPLPDDKLRHEIWTKVWPTLDLLSPDVDLMRLAEHFKLSGGNITNAGLAAAFFAATEGGSITTRQLIRAIAREYQKVGRQVSEDELATSYDSAKTGGQFQC